MPPPPPNKLPRWRGFNLLEFFTTRSPAVAQEDDFRWLCDWGFNFVRLPMCYLLWVADGDAYKLREPVLAQIDRAVELGRQYGQHINLNFHRAPGYSVNPERQEPFDLWRDQAALDAFCFQWETFAKRYRGIPSAQLSFNLVNEPGAVVTDPAKGMTREAHARVMRATVAAIRRADPGRLIILDGVQWANQPCPELADLGVGQSCRAYSPFGISHYQAPWVGGEKFPAPAWPNAWNWGEQPWGRAELERHYAPWAALVAQGVGVHCGEGGAYSKTPHDIVLRWYREVLEILTGHGIGFALWNFRGPFGILDTTRAGVEYEDWHGHQLDRAFLKLLQEF